MVKTARDEAKPEDRLFWFRQNEWTSNDMPAFGQAKFDHLQYHAFCGDLFISFVIGRSACTDYQWVWLYDGERTLTPIMGQEPVEVQGDADGIDVSTSNMQFKAPLASRKGSLQVHVKGLDLSFDYNEVDRYGRGEEGYYRVIYMPNFNVDVTYNGKKYSGRGYCKRWYLDYNSYIRYMSWRVAVGETAAGHFWWSADGNFDEDTQDYFRIIYPDGRYAKYENEATSVNREGAYVNSDNKRIKVQWQEVARSNFLVKAKPDMEWRWLQRYLKGTYTEDGVSVPTKAQDEFGHVLWADKE